MKTNNEILKQYCIDRIKHLVSDLDENELEFLQDSISARQSELFLMLVEFTDITEDELMELHQKY